MNKFKFISTIKAIILVPLIGAFGFAQAYEQRVITPEEAGYNSKDLIGLSKIVDELYEDGRIPNYVLALYKDGEKFLDLTRGKTNLMGGKNVSTSTIYPLTSITKPVVTTGLFILIEDGAVKLDDKLSDYFPAFSTMMVAPGGDYRNQFEPQKRAITIRDLVTHTSGFTYSENIAGFGDVGKTYTDLKIFSPRGGKNLAEHMETLAEVPLVAHPGEQFNYSVSTDVIGAIIEKVSGKSLADFLDERLFTPLEMSSTGFFVSEENQEDLVTIYGAEPLSSSFPFQVIGKIPDAAESIDWKIGVTIPSENYLKQPQFYSGGGGILSTPDDLARYLTMVANDGVIDGKRILGEEFAKNHKISLVDLESEALANAFGEAAKYMTFGGGFGIKREPDNQTKTDYIFWAGAFNTFFWLDLSDNSIGIFFTAHWPVKYNISDNMEQIVDEARL